MLNVTIDGITYRIDMSKEDFMSSIPSAENHIMEVEEVDIDSLDDILKALKDPFSTAKNLMAFCESQLCSKCPFRQFLEDNDYWGCKINTPYKWRLDKSE